MRENVVGRWLLAVGCALPIAEAHAAVTQRWVVETSRLQPVVFEAVHGETLALEASFQSYGTGVSTSNMTAFLCWQTNGMENAWWVTNAVTYGNSASVLFTPSMDPGAESVVGFIGLSDATNNTQPATNDQQPSLSYRASFRLRFRHGPGADPSVIQPPVRTLDFATTSVANPEASPFMVKGGSGGVTAQQATNIASAVVAPATNALSSVLYPLILERATTNDLSAATNALSSVLYPLILERATTNDVDAIIASSNLCTVAAAQAMTNGAVSVATNSSKDYADATFMPMVSNPTGITSRPEIWFSEDLGDFCYGSNKSNPFFSICEFDTTIFIDYGYNAFYSFVDGELPTYLASGAWNTASDRFAKISDISSTSVTNGGAKAYADATFAPNLSGRVYDFANGSNFTLRVYTALTNVIQTLGGTVTNPPTFN